MFPVWQLIEFLTGWHGYPGLRIFGEMLKRGVHGSGVLNVSEILLSVRKFSFLKRSVA